MTEWVVLSMVAPLVPALAWAGEAREYYGHGPGMMWGGGWFLGPIMMLVFIAGIVLVVVVVVRWLGAPGHGAAAEPPAKTALNILRERFARGEIDKEEFEDRKRVLAD